MISAEFVDVLTLNCHFCIANRNSYAILLEQIDKVYYISKGQLKPANKQYSTIPNDYEMTLSNDTVIQECTEDLHDVPTVKYEFVPISQIADKQPNAVVGKILSHIMYIYAHYVYF